MKLRRSAKTPRRSRRWRGQLAVAAILAAAGLIACGSPVPDSPPERTAGAPLPAGRSIRLGDVDPDTPARRAGRLQPLATYLAEQLADLGFASGQVVIAQNLDEMTRMLREGEVDLYLDSAFPVLRVQSRGDSEILLRRWAKGTPEYWSIIFTARDGGVSSLEELKGKFLALQDSYSTSGFVLPAGTLIERGFELREVHGPEQSPEPGVVSYFFSHDEENTIEMVVTGRAPAGAISNQDWEQLPSTLRDRLRPIDRTQAAPRQLISARTGLEPRLVARAREALLRLAGPEEPPVALDDSPEAWTWKFDEITAKTSADMRRMTEFMRMLDLE